MKWQHYEAVEKSENIQSWIRLFKEENSDYQKEMEEREKVPRIIKAGRIKDSRNSVSATLKVFYEKWKDVPVKAVGLFQSAGSGKTTKIRESILKMDGKHIVLYISSRKTLIEDEYREIKKKLENDKRLEGKFKLVYPYENKNGKANKNPFVKNEGFGAYSEISKNTVGIVNQVTKQIGDGINNNHDIIWSFFTQQAITDYSIRGRKETTLKHLRGIMRLF